jgi:protein-L-isoaspartate(D-aspartate) O-methyltransferase
LVEVTKNQPVFEASNVSGTLVGFRSPPFVKGVNVPGYHLHFLSDDETFGGHVLEFDLADGSLEIDRTHAWLRIELPQASEAFDRANLKADRGEELYQVERETAPMQPIRQPDADDRADERAAMVDHIRRYGGIDVGVLDAMSRVRRHRFVPEAHRGPDDYGDHPKPIGQGQTISQPYIVAYMTQLLGVRPGLRVLEIGTGSGYQAAVLAEMGADVWTIEIVPELADHARAALEAEGYGRVRVRAGDGYKGWPEDAPFEAILATCAPEDVPAELVRQLADGGRFILPVGPAFNQRIVILRKRGSEIVRQDDLPVRFVPMVHGND